MRVRTKRNPSLLPSSLISSYLGLAQVLLLLEEWLQGLPHLAQQTFRPVMMMFEMKKSCCESHTAYCYHLIRSFPRSFPKKMNNLSLP